jgi:Cys-tRNA(Pro) deacylase
MPQRTPNDVQAALDALHLGIRIQFQPESTATAQQAADSLGTALGSIVKSLCFLVEDRPVVVLAAGDRKVDTRKLAAHHGLGRKKVRIADSKATIEATGYAPGGVPPLGHASPLPVLVDASLQRFALVYAAAGAPNAVFPIPPDRLVSAIGGIVLDLCEDNVANSAG